VVTVKERIHGTLDHAALFCASRDASKCGIAWRSSTNFRPNSRLASVSRLSVLKNRAGQSHFCRAPSEVIRESNCVKSCSA
jgi:hypothetical protein